MSFVIVARIRAVDAAAADKIQALLADVRDYSLSDKEPGTQLYYPTRSKKDTLDFLVFEEYASQDAAKAHMTSPPFQKLITEAETLFEGGAKALGVEYYDRI